MTGGAKVGIEPIPKTAIGCCCGSHIKKAIDSAVAIAPKTVSCRLSLSFCLRPLSKPLIISFFSELGLMISLIRADVQAMSGVGTFGMGGAIGPGNIANAGYHGMPVMVTCCIQLP